MKTVSIYTKFRTLGYKASHALYAAKALARFNELESLGVVRMRCEPEEENYFDVFGTPEPYERNGHTVSEKQATKELEAILERDGVWWTVSEWFDGDEWQRADSCGMHSGYKNPLDPFENCYVVDEMRAAVDAYEKHVESLAFESSESHAMACRDISTD